MKSLALVCTLAVLALGTTVGCDGETSSPPSPRSSASPPDAADSAPIIRPQVCWGARALVQRSGEAAATQYRPVRRRSVQVGTIGADRLRRYLRGSLVATLETEWRQILAGGGSGGPEVVAEARAAVARLLADPSIFRRPRTLRNTFADAQLAAESYGFSFCRASSR